MVPNRRDADLELEALLRYGAARRLITAVVAGEWEPTPEVLEAIEVLARAGRRFYERQGREVRVA